jgi:N-acetylmuramoyl-L-alanine amidase
MTGRSLERMRLSKPICVLFAALLSASVGWSQTALRDQAGAAYQAAQQEDIALKKKPATDRSRAEYLQVIRLYERVYLITPHTGYADDSLVNIAALYEEIGDPKDAITTLQFLVREYPSSRFLPTASADIERMNGRAGETEEKAVKEVITEKAPVVAEDPSEAFNSTAAVSINNVRYWESQRSVRVVVDMSGEPSFSQGEVQAPPRVFVDIENSRVGSSLERRALPVESVMLENIRVGQYDSDTVRVVLDLVQLSNVTTFTLRDPNRLVIDVLGSYDRPATAEPLPVPEPAPDLTAVADETAPEPEEEEVVAEVRNERTLSPAQPPENGDQSLIRSLGLKVARVVIDPGHGGRDTGTIGPSGLTEKDLVLDIAQRLKERIESELDAEVFLTRDDDSFVPLETRTAMANQAEADLFLSIHANASNTQSIRGFETYFLNFSTTREGSEIAARENAASAQSISELQDLVSKIMLRDKVDESREFATHMQRALATTPDFGKDRGVKQAPFVVLIGANMPSILAEVSFISNPDDERLLKGTERRKQITDALFEGVRSYSKTLSGFETAQARD